MPLEAYHLEGEAQFWYQLMKEEEEHVSWDTLKEGLHVRSGPTHIEDFFGDLTKLTQTRTIREYRSQFKRLLSCAGKVSQEQQVGCFISRLNEVFVQISMPYDPHHFQPRLEWPVFMKLNTNLIATLSNHEQ